MTEQELDRALTGALEVEPSPDFVARVRARVATEPAPIQWSRWWPVAMAGIAAVALVVSRSLQTNDGAALKFVRADAVASVEERAASSASTRPSTGVEQVPPDARGSRAADTRAVVSPPSRRVLPEVVISPEDAAAVGLLLAVAQEAVLPRASDEQPLTVVQIDLAPIAVEPLARLTQINLGELQ